MYVIAPSTKLRLSDGRLVAAPLAENEARSGLVDYLLESFTRSAAPGPVGVVLSGAAHDGTRGLGAIRDYGGMCIAQDPATAASAGMPQSAIDAGVVDAVLAPAAIWPAVETFFADGLRPGQDASDSGDNNRADDEALVDVESEPGFQRILRALEDAVDVDFTGYKVGTLARRARRRMSLLKIGDWDDYADSLGEHHDEIEALYQDVLIGVTGFFRDFSVWEQLACELQRLKGEEERAEFRAWVPGCATGEEAYSLAILANEGGLASDSGKVQIFATDLNRHALETARRGIYPAEALDQLSIGRREKYFSKLGNDRFQIAQNIRDCVTFAPHNVLGDPPFSNMHVVSCRNMLIYLKPQAHDRVLKCLHFSLRPGGWLVLGRAERLGRQIALFDEVSKRHGIYRARTQPTRERLQVMPQPRTSANLAESPSLSSSTASSSRKTASSTR